MQDEITLTLAEEDKRIEAAIIRLLFDPPVVGPWSVGELAGELGCDITVEDGLASLDGVGLIHRSGELVFPTQAVIRAHQIVR